MSHESIIKNFHDRPRSPSIRADRPEVGPCHFYDRLYGHSQLENLLHSRYPVPTITLKGNQLTVVLNGEQILDLDLSKSALKDRPAEGYISFQDEGKPVWYRNVRIKELK
ncbi:MAG: DUF1080 domain-containing protein [Verrucomicrobiota bacterium]